MSTTNSFKVLSLTDTLLDFLNNNNIENDEQLNDIANDQENILLVNQELLKTTTTDNHFVVEYSSNFGESIKVYLDRTNDERYRNKVYIVELARDKIRLFEAEEKLQHWASMSDEEIDERIGTKGMFDKDINGDLVLRNISK